jgi:hypothetical protein
LDADAVLSNEWQEASYAIYDAFPKLSRLPYAIFPFLRTYTANVYWIFLK